MAQEEHLPIEVIKNILNATEIKPQEQRTPTGKLKNIRNAMHRVRMVFREPGDAEFLVAFDKDEFNALKAITEHPNPALNSDTAILAQRIFDDIKDVY